MKKKKSLARSFIWAYCLTIFPALLWIPFYQKGQFELRVNLYHHPLADSFFSTITHLGDGLVLIFPILLLLFFRYSYSIFFVWATLSHLLLVNLGKRILFPGMARPAEYLADFDFYTVPGVVINHWNTFPSGHTTTIFTLTCCMAMLLPNRILIQVLLLFLAVLVGISRVYLMQHFLPDVIAGSILGIASAFLGRWITIRYFSGKRYRKNLLTKPTKPSSQPIRS